MSTPENPEPKRALPDALQPRKHWPLWPFALAIAIFIPVYTYINLEYRKEGKPYEAFQAMMDRMNTIVEKNIYDWYGIKTHRVDDPVEIRNKATVTVQSGDDYLDSVIPEQLKYYMPTRPILVPGSVKAATDSTFIKDELLELHCFVPSSIANDERLHLLAFYKEGVLYLLASLFVEEFAEIENEIAGEPTLVVFAIPTDPFEAEQVNVKFLSDHKLAEWKISKVDR